MAEPRQRPAGSGGEGQTESGCMECVLRVLGTTVPPSRADHRADRYQVCTTQNKTSKTDRGQTYQAPIHKVQGQSTNPPKDGPKGWPTSDTRTGVRNMATHGPPETTLEPTNQTGQPTRQTRQTITPYTRLGVSTDYQQDRGFHPRSCNHSGGASRLPYHMAMKGAYWSKLNLWLTGQGLGQTHKTEHRRKTEQTQDWQCTRGHPLNTTAPNHV